MISFTAVRCDNPVRGPFLTLLEDGHRVLGALRVDPRPFLIRNAVGYPVFGVLRVGPWSVSHTLRGRPFGFRPGDGWANDRPNISRWIDDKRIHVPIDRRRRQEDFEEGMVSHVSDAPHRDTALEKRDLRNEETPMTRLLQAPEKILKRSFVACYRRSRRECGATRNEVNGYSIVHEEGEEEVGHARERTS